MTMTMTAKIILISLNGQIPLNIERQGKNVLETTWGAV